MKRLLPLLFTPSLAFAVDPTAAEFNRVGDRAASVSVLGYRGTDNKTYVFSIDPTVGQLPISGTINSQTTFTRNGVATSPTLDTSTATNNRPFPVTLLAGDSLAAVATGSGNTDATVLRFRLVGDQTVAISAASLPLPTGAATEATVSTLATQATLATLNGKVPSQGQAAMANSVPVAIASDQSALAVSQSGTWNINNVSGTISLPTGAATAANQTTANTSLSSIDGKLASNYGAAAGALRTASQVGNASGVADFNTGAAGAQTLRVVAANESNPLRGTAAVQLVSSSQQPYVLDMSSGNLSTSYTQIIASTATDLNKCDFFNGSSTPVYFSTGAAASEVVQYIVAPGGTYGFVPIRIASGSRLAIRSHTGTISSGYFIVNCLQ